MAKVFIFGVEWYYISALEHRRKMKYKMQLHLTLINKIYEYCHTEWFSDMLRKSLCSVRRCIYLRYRTNLEIEIQNANTSVNIYTIFEYITMLE